MAAGLAMEGNLFISTAYNWKNMAARSKAVYQTVLLRPPCLGACRRMGPPWPHFTCSASTLPTASDKETQGLRSSQDV